MLKGVQLNGKGPFLSSFLEGLECRLFRRCPIGDRYGSHMAFNNVADFRNNRHHGCGPPCAVQSHDIGAGFFKAAAGFGIGESVAGDLPDGGQHYDGRKILFSYRPSDTQFYHLFEINIDGTGLRQITPGDPPDVDNYDACYLPDGRIIYDSTAPMTGVPCVRGSSHVANLYLMNADGSGVRQLCFDQDHDWCFFKS